MSRDTEKTLISNYSLMCNVYRQCVELIPNDV